MLLPQQHSGEGWVDQGGGCDPDVVRARHDATVRSIRLNRVQLRIGDGRLGDAALYVRGFGPACGFHRACSV